ncbi:cytidine deaminase [Pseudaestuariivita sp.]|uniref:cytidine deaminase n=1 Tax=Pseudaestuariivita sp. TaxID=2211669 RepID=UPI00405935A2
MTHPLKDAAVAIQARAYAPYSKFRVGAALSTPSGAVYAGCNVENVAYPEGTCAEAGAIAAMVAGGETELAAVCIVSDSPLPCPPCGGCRQKLAEFGKPEVEVTMVGASGETLMMTLSELLPGAFSADHME